MPSSPLDSAHDQTTLGMACHHRVWAAHTVQRHRAWHAIITFGQHKRSNNVRRGMKSPPLDCIDGQTSSGVAKHHRPWTLQTVERHRARHAITTFRQFTRSNHVGHGMPSSRLGSTHGLTMSGVASHHHLWAAQTVKQHRAWHDITAVGLLARSDKIGRGMTSPPLDSTHGRTTSGVACHHLFWTANTVEQRRA